jgi:hypothetical protein
MGIDSPDSADNCSRDVPPKPARPRRDPGAKKSVWETNESPERGPDERLVAPVFGWVRALFRLRL